MASVAGYSRVPSPASENDALHAISVLVSMRLIVSPSASRQGRIVTSK